MKVIQWMIITVVVLGLLTVFVGIPMMKDQTKKFSPEETVTYNKNNYNLSVVYCSPSKKDRAIFGSLVPYNKVWRTGANEPTTFKTTSNIKIDGKNLAAGTYSLWSKPNKNSWDIIFNKEVPDWGVTILSGGAETTRNTKQDIVTVTVPVTKLDSVKERFTINFEHKEQPYLTLAWDKTKVSVPISK
ncbi:DUF2911 domain-containing protein [Cellulophaga omnivescoria]|uniref:DUF2911 domain-containing protein n=1 Tax=Cellulophaga omnivescoria TaxID=1888890 RepID=UPI000985C972|nr:DUF2911 domain-containing protein [Cellulophaga omnivescoria]WBU89470.1 DUF2911 domain-containing protein [Cellulophaga omnivescoria]WKB81493.1 DUF2911 domain-containing protein [Cellulophaga lytica]